jgi:hypothetical protein
MSVIRIIIITKVQEDRSLAKTAPFEPKPSSDVSARLNQAFTSLNFTIFFYIARSSALLPTSDLEDHVSAPVTR